MTEDEKSRKPREMVHRAQAQCARSLHRLRRARRGEAPMTFSQAQQAFHDAVMMYWEQIKRFSHRKHIETLWNEEQVFNGYTLDDLRKKRLDTAQRRSQQYDPDSNSTTEVLSRNPWTMDPIEALAVFDKLDQCAHQLGFDASPKDERPFEDWGDGIQVEADESVEVPDEV